MYKFMQIYGNCLAVHILGPNRVKGPVDNVSAKNILLVKELLFGDYYSYIKAAPCKVFDRIAKFNGDSSKGYAFPIVDIVHENPKTEKYLAGLELRMANFKAFYLNVKTSKDYFFIYSLNSNDVNRINHTFIKNNLENNIIYLKSIGLLNKIIFVGSRSGKNGYSWWSFYAKDMQRLIKKYNLIYVEVIDAGYGICDDTKTVEQFYKKASNAINLTKKKSTQNTDSFFGKEYILW